jgi:putative peptidoglycan lipid II flippase
MPFRLQFVNQPIEVRIVKRLYKSASAFSLLTLLSRLLGFGRDILWATLFGAGGQLDAFLIAFKVPNAMRRVFAEGAMSQAFLPVLTEYNSKVDRSITLRFINELTGNLITVLLAVVLVALVIAPGLILLFAPGYYAQPEQWQLATNLLRITFPYLALISLTAYLGAMLNYYRHFAAPAAAPVLLNLSFIVGSYLLASSLTTPIYALAWAATLGGLFQMVLQLLVLKHYQPLPRPHINFKNPGSQQVVKLMLPALLGVSATQISLLMDTLFASFLPAGSLSWLYYAERLIHFPQGVFGVAIATVVMPELSQACSNKASSQFKATLDWALQNVMLISLPASFGLALLAGPILTTLFHHGQFTISDVASTQTTLCAYCVGLPAFMLIKVFTASFYARQDFQIPVRGAVYALISNIVLNLALIMPFQHTGLALATALSSWINAGYLLFHAYPDQGLRPMLSSVSTYWQLVMTNVIMIAFLYLSVPDMEYWLHKSAYCQIGTLTGFILAAMAIYAIGLWMTGFSFRSFWSRQWN